MTNLVNVLLDKNVNALTVMCKDGIKNSKGVSVCNVTRKSNQPYMHLELEEVVDGVVTNHGVGLMWGRFDKNNEVVWNEKSPVMFLKTIEKGPRSFTWVCSLFKNVLASRMDEHIEAPDVHLYETLEGYLPVFNRDASFGELRTRDVLPFTDSDGVRQSTYTCFIFPSDLVSEEKITRVFGYHGRRVIEDNVPVVM